MGWERDIPVAALDTRPILGSGAVTRLMTNLIAVAALDDVAVFGHVVLFAALVTGKRFLVY